MDKLTEYLESENLLNDSQHGFRRGRSCLSQLLNHYQNLLTLMENNEVVDVIYLDFAKVFDRVDHGILLRKLRDLGIGSPLLKWIHSFLTNRKQCVVVDGAESAFSEVSSGVPQGTVLGPLLFLLHVGDIDCQLVHSIASSFADDTRIMKAVNSETDMKLLQDDLEAVYEWSAVNNMKLNGDKFQHVRYGVAVFPSGRYSTPNGEGISSFVEVKDLGVIMTNTAKFDSNIRSIVKKSMQAAGWILRVFSTRSEKPMNTQFKALVLSNLEYCSALWSPKALGMIRELESGQRSLTRNMDGMNRLEYHERLQMLKLLFFGAPP